jgi:hypothetical protein
MNLTRIWMAAVAIGLVAQSAAPAGTVSHWSMNGTGTANVGDSVPDVVGSNHGLIVNDPAEYVAGPPASPSALQFTRDTQDKVDIPDDASLHFNLDEDDFTMEAIFRVDDGSINNQGIFAKNGSAAADSQFWARYKSSGAVQFLVRGDAGDGPGGTLPPERGGTTADGSVTAGSWHHFAVVYAAGDPEATLYINYVQSGAIAMDPTDGIIGDNPDGLIIGGFTSTSREFGGAIADVRISNMALTPDQFLRIPEPGSVVLGLLGLVGLVSSGTRRR